MSDFRDVVGFEEAWRPPSPANKRLAPTVLKSARGHGRPETAKARLARVVGRAPEVMVKVTGRTKDVGHLRAHLEYISRNGELELETRDGAYIAGFNGVRDLSDDWAGEGAFDREHRRNSNLSLSVVLSMPPGTDALAMRDAVRAFARSAFAEKWEYVFALHTDAKHPHVHLTLRTLADDGERLNPRKADLEAWRQTFARSLRERGVEAEATPRRARGITRKAERTSIRKLRERHAQGSGVMAKQLEAAYADAATLASGKDRSVRPWEERASARQATVRATYRDAATTLARSADPADHALARKVERFVAEMPAVETRRQVLARELRAAFDARPKAPDREAGREPTTDRER